MNGPIVRVDTPVRFTGLSALGRSVVVERNALIVALSRAGATNIRVFGSVARGDDRPGSDVDLLVDFDRVLSLFELARLEEQLATIVGTRVDIVASDNVRPNIAARIATEAVPL